MGEHKKKHRKKDLQNNWNEFKIFLHDPEHGSWLGRTPKNWSKILLFYLIYYGILACIFGATITIVLNSVDEYTPKFQTRVQAPGVTIQPKTPSLTQQTSDIRFNLNDKDSYQKYIDYLNTFLEPYDSKNQTGDLFQKCDKGAPKTSQTFSGSENAKSCIFDRASLGECSSGNYGYDKGQPCILIKINRIINWYPIGYTDLSKAVGNEDSNAPSLAEVLKTNGQVYDPYLMYTVCYGFKDEDAKNLNGGLSLAPTKYFPQENGVGFQYYPYFGQKRQPTYLNPLVAAKFTNVTRNVDISVKCKAYAANIEDSARLMIGYFGFYLRIDDK